MCSSRLLCLPLQPDSQSKSRLLGGPLQDTGTIKSVQDPQAWGDDARLRALEVVWQRELRLNDESCCEKDKSSASCQQQRRCQYRHAVRSGFLTAGCCCIWAWPGDPRPSGPTSEWRKLSSASQNTRHPQWEQRQRGESEWASIVWADALLPLLLPLLHACGLQVAAGTLGACSQSSSRR